MALCALIHLGELLGECLFPPGQRARAAAAPTAVPFALSLATALVALLTFALTIGGLAAPYTIMALTISGGESVTISFGVLGESCYSYLCPGTQFAFDSAVQYSMLSCDAQAQAPGVCATLTSAYSAAAALGIASTVTYVVGLLAAVLVAAGAGGAAARARCPACCMSPAVWVFFSVLAFMCTAAGAGLGATAAGKAQAAEQSALYQEQSPSTAVGAGVVLGAFSALSAAAMIAIAAAGAIRCCACAVPAAARRGVGSPIYGAAGDSNWATKATAQKASPAALTIVIGKPARSSVMSGSSRV